MHDISLKKNKFLNKDQVIILLFGFILLCYYYSNIENIYTIWELDDEAGYIFNASLFSKDNWREVFSNVTAYYGYGYSLILIPLFYLCDSGLALIRGVIGVNIFCILLLYFMQIAVMSKILPECKKSVLSVCSALTCILPYLVASSMKAICEVYLTLMVWVIAWALCNVIEKKKIIYNILLCILTAYIFFIHARSIVVIASVWLVLFVQVLFSERKRKAFVSLIFGIVIFIVMYVILNIGKTYILNILGTGIVIQDNTPTINLMNSNYILDRIKWLFDPSNIAIYFHCAVGKFFYLIVTTAGTFLFAIYYIIDKIKKKKILFLKENYIELYFVATFLMMMGLCFVVGTGDTYVYFIYGRYYEYTISFFVFLGAYFLLEKSFNSIWKYIVCSLTVLFTGVITSNLESFTSETIVQLDTNRYAGFSYSINKFSDWKSMILYATLLMTVFIIFYAIIRKIKYNKILITIVILFWYVINNQVILSKINSTQQILKSDLGLIEIVHEKEPEIPVYFIYEPYKYDKYFTRLQVHLKDDRMNVILPDDIIEIPDEAFVITYIDSKISNTFKDDRNYELLKKTTHYKIYLRSKK